MTAKRSGSRRNQIVGRFVKIPKPIGENEARCNGCSAVVSLTKNGHLRKHQSPRGEDCAYTSHGRHIHLDEIPDVNLLPKPRYTKRPADEPSRLDVGSHCRICDKWLPGERSICGACYARGESNRKKKS